MGFFLNKNNVKKKSQVRLEGLLLTTDTETERIPGLSPPLCWPITPYLWHTSHNSSFECSFQVKKSDAHSVVKLKVDLAFFLLRKLNLPR